MAEHIIDIDHITKRFGDNTIINDLSLSVEQGEVLVLVGPSGCGKSMTFKAIAGIETPDSGKICLGKRELFHRGHKVNLPPRKRSVGYLFQSYALFPNMTVFQNIEAGIQGKKAAKRERAMEMMEKFHLSELASGYPARLSGGQQQTCDDKLLNGVCVCAGGVEYHDARLGAALDGDVVHAHARTGDGEQLGREVHVEELGRADHDALGIRLAVADLIVLGVEALETGCGNLVESLNVIHGNLPPGRPHRAAVLAPERAMPCIASAAASLLYGGGSGRTMFL